MEDGNRKIFWQLKRISAVFSKNGYKKGLQIIKNVKMNLFEIELLR